MKAFKVQIAAPDGLRYDGEAVQLSVRGIGGDLAILAGHIPMMTTIRPGTCRVVTADGETRTGATHGGILTVGKDSVIALLGDWEVEENGTAQPGQ